MVSASNSNSAQYMQIARHAPSLLDWSRNTTNNALVLVSRLRRPAVLQTNSKRRTPRGAGARAGRGPVNSFGARKKLVVCDC